MRFLKTDKNREGLSGDLLRAFVLLFPLSSNFFMTVETETRTEFHSLAL